MYRGAIIAVLTAVALLVPSATGAPNFVIVRDVSVGGFPREGTVKQAIAVFGRPGARENIGGDTCRLTWPSIGVTMETWYEFSARIDPCGPFGRHRQTTATDRRWRTSVGLEIGDPLRTLRKLYPKARKDAPGKWRLTTRPFVGLPFPGLEAEIKSGRVVSFTVYGPRSGF